MYGARQSSDHCFSVISPFDIVNGACYVGQLISLIGFMCSIKGLIRNVMIYWFHVIIMFMFIKAYFFEGGKGDHWMTSAVLSEARGTPALNQSLGNPLRCPQPRIGHQLHWPPSVVVCWLVVSTGLDPVGRQATSVSWGGWGMFIKVKIRFWAPN